MTTPSEDIRFTLRLPAGLHQRLAAAAAREHRSINAQIVRYIERGLDQGEDQ
jgi:predicted HicB family RNase H-like nuclease